MLVFAWILWVYVLIVLSGLIIIMAYYNYKKTKYKVDIEKLLFHITIFVFLTIYIFSKM